MDEHLKWLGLRVLDVVTGFAGIVTAVSFDLYGCVQAVVSPSVNEKGDLGDGRWFDTKRLTVTSDTPVMAVPSFAVVPGPTEKPVFQSQPG